MYGSFTITTPATEALLTFLSFFVFQVRAFLLNCHEVHYISHHLCLLLGLPIAFFSSDIEFFNSRISIWFFQMSSVSGVSSLPPMGWPPVVALLRLEWRSSVLSCKIDYRPQG